MRYFSLKQNLFTPLNSKLTREFSIVGLNSVYTGLNMVGYLATEFNLTRKSHYVQYNSKIHFVILKM